MLRIGRDQDAFHRKLRREIKQNLDKYITRGEMIGKVGDKFVSIPLPQIQIPQFRYGNKGNGGVGQGDGDIGQSLGPQQGQGGSGTGSGGGGEHILEVEVDLDTLAEILGEALTLPRLLPKQTQGQIVEHKDKYTGIRSVGPESLRHFKRSFKRALRRNIAGGTYIPGEPFVIQKEDKQYKAGKPVPLPETVALLINMMDVSGSMSDEMKQIARILSWWTELWIKHHYKGIDKAYIIHDDTAKLVDEHTFYHTRESGGTKISSAFDICDQICDGKLEVETPQGKKTFTVETTNFYGLYVGDGDNFSGDDQRAIEVLSERLLAKLNLLGYVEVGNNRSTFMDDLESGNLTKRESVRTAKCPTRTEILPSIRSLFEARVSLAGMGLDTGTNI